MATAKVTAIHHDIVNTKVLTASSSNELGFLVLEFLSSESPWDDLEMSDWEWLIDYSLVSNPWATALWDRLHVYQMDFRH